MTIILGSKKYFYGGSFLLYSKNVHMPWLVNISRICGIEVLAKIVSLYDKKKFP